MHYDVSYFEFSRAIFSKGRLSPAVPPYIWACCGVNNDLSYLNLPFLLKMYCHILKKNHMQIIISVYALSIWADQTVSPVAVAKIKD